MARRRRLGEVLVDDGVITDLDLARALEEQNNSGGIRLRLGTQLVALGVATEGDIADALANQLKLERVDLNKESPELSAISRVPADVARRHQVVPMLFDDQGTLVVAMTDPTNVLAIDELRMTTRAARVRPVVGTEAEVAATIERFYAGTTSMADVDDFTDGFDGDEDDDVNSAEIESKPIVRLANTIIVDAVRLRASDIHVEPTRGDVRVRFRVDGILTEVMKVPRPARAPLTSRLKLMAGMDISERRRPQDGRTAVNVHGQAVDLRVSSMPSMHGEKIVMRLLRRGGERLELDDLQLAPDVHSEMLESLESPQGIILITGPTGSGKTTTVYAGLAEVATVSRNVITLEDPIEYELDLVNQTQVNPRIGFTFAVGMRTVLRQDPDVVMVGEIRDSETAELAFEAAMTGHLVLSTVHTNDAPSTVLRMSELGVERHLIASSLSLIVAQRLVRVVCPKCAKPDNSLPDARLLRRLRLPTAVIDRTTTRRRGSGCHECADTGYQGRSSVTEVLHVTPRIRDLITDGAGESTIRNVAREDGMRSMRQDGIVKVLAGITTFEEVVRATPDDPRLDTTRLVEAMIDGNDGFAPYVIERRNRPRRRPSDAEAALEAEQPNEDPLAKPKNYLKVRHYDHDGVEQDGGEDDDLDDAVDEEAVDQEQSADQSVAEDETSYDQPSAEEPSPAEAAVDEAAVDEAAVDEAAEDALAEDDAAMEHSIPEALMLQAEFSTEDTPEGPDLDDDPDELVLLADGLMSRAEAIMEDPDGDIEEAERLIDEAEVLTSRARDLRKNGSRSREGATAHTG